MSKPDMHLAAVDYANGQIYVEESGLVGKYDLAMLAAALANPKYWEDAHLGDVDDTIPEILKWERV